MFTENETQESHTQQMRELFKSNRGTWFTTYKLTELTGSLRPQSRFPPELELERETFPGDTCMSYRWMGKYQSGQGRAQFVHNLRKHKHKFSDADVSLLEAHMQAFIEQSFPDSEEEIQNPFDVFIEQLQSKRAC